MRVDMWKWAPALAALIVAAGMTPSAGAQCSPALKLPKRMSWGLQSGSPQLRAAAFLRDDHDSDDAASIVGMWHVIFTATTINGTSIPDTVVDNSLVVWHEDKTEIMNSGRPAQDGNFCMGVWEKTGRSSYRLNHFAWAGNDNPPGTPEGVVGAPIGPVQYQEAVTVSPDGRQYTGTFTLRQYDTKGGVAVTFTGTLKATRITLGTTAKDLTGL